MTSIVIGKDRISLLESERYIAGTKNVYTIKVSFSEDWEGLEKKLIFKTDTFEQGVDILSCSETLPIPWEVLAQPTTKLQVGAYGYECNEVVLNTRWASLGRVSKGTVENNCCCAPGVPIKPSPNTYDFLKKLIDQKADRLTIEDGMMVLWAGEDPLSSFEMPISLPDGGEKDQVLAKASDKDGDYYWRTVNGSSAFSHALRVPLGTIEIWSGSIEDIPESYSLCDGQNGTPDLRTAMIIGASEFIEPGTVVGGPEEGVPMPVSKTRTSVGTVRYYALAFIQKTSLTEADLKEGKTAYELAVDNGYEGTEEEWLSSLKGPSAYQVAVNNGFKGTENEWVASLRGEPGEPGHNGASAYEIAVQNGYEGTEQDFANQFTSLDSFVVNNTVITNKSQLPSQTSGSYLFMNVRFQSSITRTKVILFNRDAVYVDLTATKQIILTDVHNTRYVCTLDDNGSITKIDVETLTDQIIKTAGSSSGDGSGIPGKPGASAYEIAVENGFDGTEEEWLASLKGSTGLSAYQVAKANGFEGTEAEWVESLKGARGEDGASAYQIAVNEGFDGTEQDWLKSLKGNPGLPGDNGISAYEVAVNNGFEGSESEWLASLKGSDGKSAYQIAVENGYQGSEQDWLSSITQGSEGKSAYDIAVENGFTGTQEQWLESLIGPKGDAGKSAYESAVENGFEGTQSEWLESLKGKAVQTIQDYSTGETIVGRWIDKRPIYRNVIETTVTPEKTVTVFSVMPGIEPIGSIQGTLEIQNGSRIISLPGFEETFSYGLGYEVESGNLELYASGTSLAEKRLRVILEYVKNGDGPLSDDQLIVNPTPSETGTSDHRNLLNRDAANQHPMSSIGGLSDRLAVTPTKNITDEQINALFA